MSKAKKKTQQRRSPAEISSSNKRLADEIRRRALLQTGALPELPVEVQLEMPVQTAFEAPPEPIPAPAPPESFMPVRRGRPPVGEESRTVPARMAAVMGDRTMTAGEVEAALEAVGERLQSGNVRSYISTTLNSSTTSVLDSSGQPLRYRSGWILKVHVFTSTERGRFRVSTPQDILAEAERLLARDEQVAAPDQGAPGLNGAHGANVPPMIPVNDVFRRNGNGGRAHLGNGSAAALAHRALPQPVLDVLNERIGQVLLEVLTPYLKVMAAFDDRN